MADQEYLSTRQAAQRLGVSLGTVQNMVESGALEAWKTAGGHRRIPVASIDAVLARRRAALGKDNNGMLDLLIAEDEPMLRTLYESTIESWNLPIRLRMVENGFDGLIEVGQRTPDILIADLMMPGMDGFEMIRRLREKPELAQMDIIVISAIERHLIAEKGLPSDVTVFGKPIPFHEIKGFVLGRLAAQQRTV
ncbi:response regulator [Dechloromonas sp. ZY10]|uniref:response regulator n=1 Tax=Dechloromonas aquae TaxID=2664436 RepID=UPI003527AE8B